MTKRPVKLLSVWIAISSVIIIAGIVLFCLLGFNRSAEKTDYKSVEVQYDVVTDITTDAVDTLKKTCNDTFKAQGLKVTAFEAVKEVDSNSGSETGNIKLVYSFSPSVSDEAIQAAGSALKTVVSEALKDGRLPSSAEIFVNVHAGEGRTFYEAIWRGAVGLAVGAVVAFVYIGVRFGVAAALTGLTNGVNAVLLTLAFFAITRIPVYAFAPLLFAAVAAIVSLLIWLLQCMKMRENFKDPSYAALSADDAVEQSSRTARKYVIGVVIALAVVLAVCGGFATAGVRLFLLSALIPVAAASYSSIFFGPALHVPVKSAFDRMKANRKKNYAGKPKAEKENKD